jgi:hypothetical protein
LIVGKDGTYRRLGGGPGRGGFNGSNRGRRWRWRRWRRRGRGRRFGFEGITRGCVLYFLFFLLIFPIRYGGYHRRFYRFNAGSGWFFCKIVKGFKGYSHCGLTGYYIHPYRCLIRAGKTYDPCRFL